MDSLPGVHVFQRLFADALAVGVEEDLVAEDAKVDLLPLAALVGEDLGPLPTQRLQTAVVLLDGELDRLPVGVEPDGELRLAPRVGDADEVPAPTL